MSSAESGSDREANVKIAPAREHEAGTPRALSYWEENLRLLAILLAIWFTVSFGILLRDALDSFSILGVPAGFWFAQQGSIYVFIALIFAYSHFIQKIERRHGVDDEGEGGQ
ncbi:DUF4212 domain-containing protein [Parvularcula maris]|uniref:DUF4212 domain-containing protein n=1 Tax=Parvularcula maris TaxID=2965077 RepID=A0A9X2LAD0_9PROT|nr:DUF4212 domain-containing protein [Parvularcula maris]MCQ8186070.1 DUF4212 domain-containing protein [Parvularcula maris]